MVDFKKARLTKYAIGPVEGQYTHGPSQLITPLFDEIPETNPAFIFKITPEGEINRLYRWREGTGKWVRIKDWRSQ